jgi:hypothetical protein
MRTLPKACLLSFAVLLSGWLGARAQSNPNISVSSTHDGTGLFSYTFTLGNPNFAWGFSTNQTTLTMRFHGVQTVFSPAGWTSQVDTNDFVTWRYLNADLVLLGDPSITFTIQSSSTTTALYDRFGPPDPDYPRGIVVGAIYDAPNRTPLFGGYETFSYVGPAVVPEPSSSALFLTAALGAGYTRLSRRLRAQFRK